jgi:flagellar biosynthetic protein FliP|tara:strand:+ start:1452 stop:2258 length:807 start_codon:yes stop_codon:yes gene_type:complete
MQHDVFTDDGIQTAARKQSQVRAVIVMSVLGVLTCLSPVAWTAEAIPAFNILEANDGGTEYSLSLQLLILMTVLGLLPSILILMTSFTRIIIVLSLLRQAMGTAQTPPNQVLVGIAIFLSLFVMTPVIEKIYTDAFEPVQAGEMSFETGLSRARVPLQEFMLGQTREKDILLFMDMADTAPVENMADIPFTVLVPAFITSELKTAFTIGFLIYIPFVIIDLVVASVLMSMGMMMLSPMMISLPFKLLLFVLVDGWGLITGSLVATFMN